MLLLLIISLLLIIKNIHNLTQMSPLRLAVGPEQQSQTHPGSLSSTVCVCSEGVRRGRGHALCEGTDGRK